MNVGARIDELRQLASNPSDAFTAGIWCEALNEALEIVAGLLRVLEDDYTLTNLRYGDGANLDTELYRLGYRKWMKR